MNKISKFTSLLFIIPMMLAGCVDSSNSSSSEYPYDIGSPEDFDGYYASTNIYNPDATPAQLQISLHNLMIETHTTYTTYQQCYTYIPGGADLTSNNELYLYWSGNAVQRYGGNWNREHVWPRSKSNTLFNNVVASTKGAGSDLYHIRPTDPTTNSDHWNYAYGEVQNDPDAVQLTEDGVGAGWVLTKETMYEPKDEFKGDTARILLYVMVHYSSSYGQINEYCGSLGLLDVMSINYTLEECYELLCRWNELDPVDEVELRRNDYVQTIQGNRNPFIDYPDLVNRILVY